MDRAALHPRRGDGGAILLVAGLALLLFFLLLPHRAAGAAEAVQIRREGVLLRTLSLKEDGVYPIDGPYPLEVTVAGGRVAVTASRCPNGDCRRRGWIDKAGESIHCLPGRIELRLVGVGGVDAVSG